MSLTLDEVPVPVRCHEDRGGMQPTARGSYCGACQHEVVDLSAMSEHDVRRLLRASAGARLCVTYQPLSDGTIETRRERTAPTLPREALLRKARPAALAAAAILASGCGPAYDLLPESVRAALPDVAQAALQHPADFAACAVDAACDASEFGRIHWVPIVRSPPVMGLYVELPTPPVEGEGADEALPEPCTGGEEAGD